MRRSSEALYPFISESGGFNEIMMMKFEEFYHDLLNHIQDSKSLLLMERLYNGLFPGKPRHPNLQHLWGAFFSVIMSDNSVNYQSIPSNSLDSIIGDLSNLNLYVTKKDIAHTLEKTFFFLLPNNTKKKLINQILQTQSQLKNWLSGYYHEKMKLDLGSAFSDIFENHAFENEWKCASWLNKMGYKYPMAKNAFEVWLKVSGDNIGSDDHHGYRHWLTLLQSLNLSPSNQHKVDFFMGTVFSDQNLLPLPSLCVNRLSCAICPFNQKCRYLKNNNDLTKDLEIETQLRTGNADRIQTERLIRYLTRTYWQETENQRKMIVSFPDLFDALLNSSGFSEIDSLFLLKLMALKEFGYRLKKEKTSQQKYSFTQSRDVFDHFKNRSTLKQQECFYTLILDNSFSIIKTHLVSKGTLDKSLVHPREVFAPAIQLRAAAIIIVHNHPQGSPKPSKQDRIITLKLFEAANLIGIEILDHIIIGDESYFSFKDEDLLPIFKEYHT
ncbi:MAG: DNA repair protein RadC [Deltaproteobacteria bacterium]|nr:DNA repair protein RadC [Deltaproteobacteria bacterium]